MPTLLHLDYKYVTVRRLPAHTAEVASCSRLVVCDAVFLGEWLPSLRRTVLLSSSGASSARTTRNPEVEGNTTLQKRGELLDQQQSVTC